MTARVVAPGVVVDPKVCWGEPCIAGTGVSTASIAERFRAGETIPELTGDYGVRIREVHIEDALRWELTPYSTRRRRIAKALKGTR